MASKYPIQNRINKIFKDYLKTIDKELFDYLVESNTEVTIFLQRWLRCAMIREFDYSDLLKIWDVTFAMDMEKIITNCNYKASFVFLDYLSTYMIHKQREYLLNKDIHSIYEILLNLKSCQGIEEIIKSALQFKDKLFQISSNSKVCSSTKIINIKNDISLPPLILNSNIVELIDTRLTDTKHVQAKYIDASSPRNKIQKIHKEIKRLQHIYLKYKDKFSLKDSKEFLNIIIKLKLINTELIN